MIDVVNKATRSRMMAGIRARDTKPEIIVRKYFHKSGFRFRLSPSDIVGKPDIVLPKYRAVVFVHGCYWHRHAGCKYATTPNTNKAFWISKFESNLARDGFVKNKLEKDGWRVDVVWECEINEKQLDSLCKKIAGYLG